MCCGHDPLLTEFEDAAEQGIVNHLQLAEWASMDCLLLATLEEHQERINFGDLLCCPLGMIYNTYIKFICGLSQQLPLIPQMLGSSQDVMLSATCSITHTNLSYFHCAIFSHPLISIPTLTQYKINYVLYLYGEKQIWAT